MTLNVIDWAIIAAYFAVSLAIGLYYSKRAGKDVAEYFLSGRDLPWWLAGTSMVATTFAADTPLAVAGFVRATALPATGSGGTRRSAACSPFSSSRGCGGARGS